MLPLLKAAFMLLSLLELISSTPLMTTLPKVKLSEITHRIQQLNSGVQLSEQELLCQAAMALMKVTRCRKDYEPFIINLQSLHGKTNCSLSNENEIYLRNFLPKLGNFTQGMYRRLATSAAQ
uniref:B-cell stimulatory factor 1 n=1 Tax=Falco tinnunculus TaxID=100819 RepID=A0A8C4UV06_FALTI